MRTIVLIVSFGYALFLPFLFVTAPADAVHPGNADSMIVVSRGWFTMGADSWELNERPEHDIFLKAFLIDRYEVSAEEFAAFLNDQGNSGDRFFSADEYSTVMKLPSVNNGSGTAAEKSGHYAPKKGYENFPANNVSWFGADAFCRWKGKRLPTEAEWEKAARGSDLSLYPWGNSTPDALKARFDQRWEDNGLLVMLPVDSLPDGASDYGVLNMAGNVLEWVNDWYRQNYCNFCDPGGEKYYEAAADLLGVNKPSSFIAKKPEEPPKYDPSGPLVGTFKVLRGGAWDENLALRMRASYRYWLAPLQRDRKTGFRCVKNLNGEAAEK